MKYLTTDEFKKKVMDYTAKGQKFLGTRPAIIKFTAEWCGPCKMMNPVLEQIEKDYDGKLDIYNVDVDNEHEPAAAFGIRSIPNMIFIPIDGAPERMVGALPRKSVTDAIKRLFKIEPAPVS
jgi:thioredoxin